MSRKSSALFTIILLVAAPGPTVTAAAEPNPLLAINVENVNGWKGVNLHRAQKLATEIYEQAGVTLDWSGGAAPAGRTLTIVLTTITTAPQGIAPESMGVAPSPGDGSRGTTAYVFMDRVTSFAAAHRVSAEYVLACALAHEIGHLLLPPNAHHAIGVMRSNWHAKLFPPHAPGVPGFPPDQARLLRLRAGSR
jgi:hypothetical protein